MNNLLCCDRGEVIVGSLGAWQNIHRKRISGADGMGFLFFGFLSDWCKIIMCLWAFDRGKFKDT